MEVVQTDWRTLIYSLKHWFTLRFGLVAVSLHCHFKDLKLRFVFFTFNSIIAFEIFFTGKLLVCPSNHFLNCLSSSGSPESGNYAMCRFTETGFTPKGSGAPWTWQDMQTITGIAQRKRETAKYTLTFTPFASLELAITMIYMSLDCGRRLKYPHISTQRSPSWNSETQTLTALKFPVKHGQSFK